MRLVGIATSLLRAHVLINRYQPQLMLLDNHLPDGKGITLVSDMLQARANASVIFITAASDMDTCSLAIRNGVFDYILKPVVWKRLEQSLARFVQFHEQLQTWKIVDQQNVDALYLLHAKNYCQASGSVNTLSIVKALFHKDAAHSLSVDDVMASTRLSKTTTRRYLEHCVTVGFLQVEMLYGKVGHPRRLYKRKDDAVSPHATT